MCLSLEEQYAASFISPTRDISSILDLFDLKYLELKNDTRHFYVNNKCMAST